MKLLKSQLPSRGILYPNTPEELVINTNSLEFFKKVSVYATSSNCVDMEKALQYATGIADPLTMGDYYALGTLCIVLSKEIPWEWNCEGTVVEFDTTAVGSKDLFEDMGLTVTEREDSLLVRTPSGKDAALILSDLKALGLFGKDVDVLGRQIICKHHNKKVLTPELLVKHFVQIDEACDPETVAMAYMIDEYKELETDPSLSRVLTTLTHMPMKYGPTLRSRLAILQSHPDIWATYGQAKVNEERARHGIKKLLSCQCDSCGAKNVRSFAFSAEHFF